MLRRACLDELVGKTLEIPTSLHGQEDSSLISQDMLALPLCEGPRIGDDIENPHSSNSAETVLRDHAVPEEKASKHFGSIIKKNLPVRLRLPNDALPIETCTFQQLRLPKCCSLLVPDLCPFLYIEH